MPKFVENHPKLKAAWIEKWQILVENSHDISEVIINNKRV